MATTFTLIKTVEADAIHGITGRVYTRGPLEEGTTITVESGRNGRVYAVADGFRVRFDLVDAGPANRLALWEALESPIVEFSDGSKGRQVGDRGDWLIEDSVDGISMERDIDVQRFFERAS